MRLLLICAVVWGAGGLSACSDQPTVPEKDNLCRIFITHPNWIFAAQQAHERWQVPVSTMMAIIYQESHYIANATPPVSFPFDWLKGIAWHGFQRISAWIPGLRPTSALGYAQAINETWRLYCRSRGRVSANRHNFEDAIDFVGWYVDMAHRQLHIPKEDVYSIYLAYHEGIGGYAAKSYQHQFWLQRVARNVAKHAKLYHQQLYGCYGP